MTIRAPHKHDPVRDRINAINARFCSADGTRHLFITRNCKHTIESLDKYTFKEGTQIPDKGEWDHQFDALSYCIAFLYPIKRNLGPQKPQSWGIRTEARY